MMRRLSLGLWAVLVAGVVPVQAAGSGPVTDLTSPSAAVRQNAVRRLGDVSAEQAVPLLVGMLADPSAAVRAETARALGARHDQRAVPALIRCLADPDTNVRLYVVEALGEIAAPAASDALLQTLRDRQWVVRDRAAWALSVVGDSALVPRLVTALADEGLDGELVVWLLQRFERDEVFAALAAVPGTASPVLRSRVVVALQKLNDPRGVPLLLGYLADGDPAIRGMVCRALTPLRDVRAREPLERLLQQESKPAVRQAAQEALYRLSRRTDLAACWSFESEPTDVVRDETGRGNDGRCVGCRRVPGQLGSAWQFDIRSGIEFGRPADLDMTDRPLTVMAWVKSDAPRGVIIARGGKFCGFSLYVLDSKPRFGIHRFQDGPTQIAAGRDSVVGRWAHLAGVIRDTRLELYVDGQLAAAVETEGPLPGNSGQGLEIGFDAGNSPAEITDHFQGAIDEVRIFQAGLSAAEVTEQMRVALVHREADRPGGK